MPLAPNARTHAAQPGPMFRRAVTWAAIVATILPPAFLTQAASLEPPIVPTGHPVLSPSSAIPVPLRLQAQETLVWRRDLEQRIFLRGAVTIDVGYRRLQAGQAVLWLTPSREGGESTYDVAIYLTDNVRVQETNKASGTITTSKELLVTTRIAQSALLVGNPTPIKRDEQAKFEKETPAFARGEELRQDLLNKPVPPAFIPTITITDAETALQRGWIARGPGNQLIAGPADIALALSHGASGTGVPSPAGPNAPAAPKPRPQVLLVVDRFKSYRLNDKEQVTVAENAFLMRDNMDKRPPLELRAQHVVLFSPVEKDNATQPTTAPGGRKGEYGDVAKVATGVYLEGDVTLMSGSQQVRATRLYYDFLSDRAIMLDATLSAVDEKRNIPVYMRAAEIRQISRTEFTAKDAKFTTSEFYTPHYHIGASNIYLQDVTAKTESGADIVGEKTFEFAAKDATIQVQGVPIFYWPYLSGSTSKEPLPIKKLRISNSKTYGPTIQTDWDIFGLAGQVHPKGITADLQLDYFGKRGPAAGVDAKYELESALGLLRSYGIYDTGTDRLGRDPARQDLPLETSERGRLTARHKQALDDNWTLTLEGSYITDPNFLETYFTSEFDTDKEQETVFYLKRQDETSALTFLGKWSLYDFTANADLVDDQFTTEKKPEIKYYRIGDSILDVFTYYSETGLANVNAKTTNYSPSFSGLQNIFAQKYFAAYGSDYLARINDTTIRDLYRQKMGWTTDSTLRGDTRQEIDMPLTLGDVKITPYVTGRFTYWDNAFPADQSGDTTRVTGGGGVRAATQFWKVYDEVESTFLDLHRMRHIVEPSVNVFGVGSDQNHPDIQIYDRDVEAASHASGMQMALAQRWQTKRGGPGHWRTTDWITFNMAWNYFWDQNDPNRFLTGRPLRGFYFPSRPDLSLVRNSIAMDGSWRIGERVRLVGDGNVNTDSGTLEQASGGIAFDQSPNVSYFIGDRYVTNLNLYEPFSEGGNFTTLTPGPATSNEITFAIDYRLTRKYNMIFSESFDTAMSKNIVTSVTLVRRLPRFNMALTGTFDANENDTTFTFTMWPEGMPELGVGSNNLKGSR